MTISHSSLTGDELHNAKIPMGGHTSPPAFVGQTAFGAGALWVADPSGWKLATPPLFSWIVDTSGYQVPQGWTLTHANLFFYPTSSELADSHASEFELIKSWQVGVDWAVGSPIDISPQLQANGIGCYALLLSGDDAYGGVNQPMPAQELKKVIALPLASVDLFTFNSSFAGLGGSFYEGVIGFDISGLLAQVLLSVETV